MEKSLKHLAFLEEQTWDVMEHGVGVGNHITKFFLGLIERVWAASPGLTLLMGSVPENPNLEFSAGLVLRTLILDYLFALHTYGIHQTGIKEGKSLRDVEKEVLLYCDQVFADSLRYTLKHVQEVQQEGWISEADLFQHYKEFANRYPEYVGAYKEDGKMPSISFDNPKQGKGIYQHLSKDTSLKHLAEYYDMYVCYSKYEHFGVFSYELLRQPAAEKIKRLESGIHLLVLHFFLCLEMLQAYLPANFIKDKYKVVGGYIHTEIFPDMPV